MDYSKGVVKLHWGSCGATMGLRWHTQSGRKALYYGEPRARMQIGATLGLWWVYTGAVVALRWGCDDTRSPVGKHQNYGEPRARARARMRLEATLELWWGYTGTVVGLHLGLVGLQWDSDVTQSLVCVTSLSHCSPTKAQM